MNYKIATTTPNELDAIKRAENLIKKETGKDFIMIAWQKDK